MSDPTKHSNGMIDPFMSMLGMECEICAPGESRVWGTVRAEFLNNLNIAHGGFVYTLADAAFAMASNSHGIPAVALSTHIEYLQPGQPGTRLEAVAKEVHLGYRTGVYRVEVRSGETLLAIFTGTVYRKQPHPDKKSEAK
jgi:acyl-CoA thioesterase